MARDLDPIQAVLDRVGVEHPSPSYFDGHEVERWPPEAATAMVRLGLLVETTRAQSTICTGCELACHKPVVVRGKPGADTLGGFIVCDEDPKLGRIRVPMNRLRRFRASFTTLAHAAAVFLGLDTLKLVTGRDRVAIGHIRGRFGLRAVALEVRGRQLALAIGTHEKPLTELLAWTEGRAVIDHREIARMVSRKDRPRRSRGIPSATDRADALAKRNHQIMRHGKRLRAQGMSWPRVAAEIARLPFIASPNDGLRPIITSTVRRILAARD